MLWRLALELLSLMQSLQAPSSLAFFPTAKIGAPESGGVELRILATGGERELYVSSSPPTAGAFWCKI